MLPGSIDGSATPQLIPDSTAYRVFFRAFTADADLARQQAMLSRAHLSPADFQSALGVGTYFQTLRAAYLQQVKAAQLPGATIDQETLLSQQTAIGTGRNCPPPE